MNDNQTKILTTLAFCILSLAISAQESVKVKLDDHETRWREQIEVDISVFDFKKITSFQFALNWNPSLLSFKGVRNVNEQLTSYDLESSFNTSPQFTEEGRLVTVWADLINFQALTLPDSSVLFSVVFEVITRVDRTTTVELCTDCGLAVEFTTEQGRLVPYETSGGNIKIQNTIGSNLLFQMDDLCAREGERIEVDVNTRNFRNMLGVQFEFQWDSLSLKYVEVKNLNPDLVGLEPRSFFASPDGYAKGYLRFSWFSIMTSSISIDDGRLFTVAFDVISAKDTLTDVGICETNCSLQMEFINNNNINQNFVIQNAQVATNKPTVKLHQFVGIPYRNRTYLRWQTTYEPNDLGFHVERSIDQSTWEEIGFVRSKGISTERQRYLFIDRMPVDTSVHYRLKQMEFCNTTDYFLDTLTISQSPDVFTMDTLIVSDTLEINETFSLYPNPSSDFVHIEIGEEAVKSIILLDLYGNTIKSIKENIRTVPIQDLPVGTYHCIVETEKGIRRKVFVKLLSD
ncbi:MAG: T9SS type A sorting domain-containing protein [Bacteroidota bacterium]